MTSFHQPVALANCEQEPIHVPGAIQPHGVLFACHGSDLRVAQVSVNVSDFLKLSPEDVIGRSLNRLFAPDAFRHLCDPSVEHRAIEGSPFRVAASDGSEFDAVAHASGPAVVIEIEPRDHDRAPGFEPRLRASVQRLQSARTVHDLLTIAAEEVRRINGFDRVMVYRFDADWNGEVVAESRRDDLEPFLGLHYPASDIPAQARRLYTSNWLRFIADVGYQPAKIVPRDNPVSGGPLDLSQSVLRSVSPIHLEYLQNMGVTASMSISLLIDGVLAGLIACHHYSGPRIVPLEVRSSAEYLGSALSWQLQVLESASAADKARSAQRYETELVRSVAVASDLLQGLDAPAFVNLTSAHGAAIVLEEGTRLVGNAPPLELVQELVRWLGDREDDVFVTDHLAKELPLAAAHETVAAGVLVVPIARELGEYLLWFRPAVTQLVSWAGEPKKRQIEEPGRPPRLSPRGSFALWREEVKGRSLPWQRWEIDAATSLRRVILAGVRRRTVELRTMNERLLDADRAKDEFIATVSHELRNPLHVVSGWTSLLKSGALDPARVEHALEVIEQNVKVQLKLVDDLLDMARSAGGKLVLDANDVDLPVVVDEVLDGMTLAARAKSIALHREICWNAGPIRGDVDRLRQIVANLVTNAIKFTPKDGQITVRLARVDSHAELSVRDDGEGIAPELLPHVFEVFRQADSRRQKRAGGLGLGLAIVKNLAELHGGSVDVESVGANQGSTFRVRLPLIPASTQAD